jgi:hypothetical protein
MVLAAVPVLGLHIGQSGVTTLPGNLPSKQGYLAVQRYFPGQSQDPAEIVSVGGTGTARGRPRQARNRAGRRPALRARRHPGLA